MDKSLLTLEAIFFAAEQPVTVEDILLFCEKQNGIAPDRIAVENQIQAIIQKYDEGNFPFSLRLSGGGYLFQTLPEYHEAIVHFLHRNTVKRLTGAALETLSIIAYQQPTTKAYVESVRGVNSDYAIQKLMEKELVEIKGRSQEAGKPLLYGTTPFFLDYFGINRLDELPKLREFQESENQIGEKESIVQTGRQ